MRGNKKKFCVAKQNSREKTELNPFGDITTDVVDAAGHNIVSNEVTVCTVSVASNVLASIESTKLDCRGSNKEIRILNLK